MKEIKLYNTLSKKKEIFRPISQGSVSMYHCGPTVYDRAHIGNLRSYVFADLLRRTMEYNGLSVKQVINITDIGHLVSDGDEGEDKMTKALKRENKPLTLEAMNQLATKYFEYFKQDLSALNIETPQYFPRASEHIKEDIELIQEIEKNGFAYTGNDGLYFDTTEFENYGEIVGGREKLAKDDSFSRTGSNSQKKSHLDFLLWKLDNSIGYESPWGKGFPGWHIECSAMARKYLGQPFDIHTGGVDHIPVHHNNEIAQSEAAYGKPLANVWMHNEFITIDDGKMAKSAGNFITLATLLEQSLSPLSYRYWLMTSHYKSQVNFSYEAVRAAQTALIKLMNCIVSYPDGGKIDSNYKDLFTEKINNDLDLPQAIALVWQLIKDNKISDADKKTTILDFDRVLGLSLSSLPKVEDTEIPAEIMLLVEARDEARKNKDWAKADAMRLEIENRGFELHDDGSKSIVVRK